LGDPLYADFPENQSPFDSKYFNLRRGRGPPGEPKLLFESGVQ